MSDRRDDAVMYVAPRPLPPPPTEPLEVELVRMALAEAGYQPGYVSHFPGCDLEGGVAVGMEDEIPFEVLWRARELASARTDGEPVCQACFGPKPIEASSAYAFKVAGPMPDRRCDADQILTADCGRERA